MAVTKPSMVSRASWGASAPRNGMTSQKPVTRLIVHHTVSSPHIKTGTDAKTYMKNIQTMHMDLNNPDTGFDDIGYHFVIASDGVIYEGRGLQWQGAHTVQNKGNIGSVGVSLMGNFQANSEFRTAQRDALVRLLAWLVEKYGLGVSSSKITTHYNVANGATECPGKYILNQMDDIRSRVARYIADSNGNSPE